ncbi:MAG TPA: RNA polymerase sigma factor, partial [Terriglobia bacterium]|nr:RNA polymerase sigma factor [Terriglobia bacterium]
MWRCPFGQEHAGHSTENESVNPLVEKTDIELMLAVRDGVVSTLGILFERYHERLYNFFVRHTNRRDASEDLVQDVFFRMLKYRHTYRGDAPFTVWMYQLARNASADYFKKWRQEMPMAEDV